MNSASNNWPAKIGVALVVLFGSFLVAYEILGTRALRESSVGSLAVQRTDQAKSVIADPPKIEAAASLLPKIPEAELKRSVEEVHNYVLFKMVPLGIWEVGTGVSYSSTDNPVITRQWCYLTEKKSLGQLENMMELMVIESDGKRHVPNYDHEVLTFFDLTQESAEALITSHCRFE